MNVFKILILLICVLLLSGSLQAQGIDDKVRSDAERYISDGKFGEAIDILNKYVSENPSDPYGYNTRGIAFEKRANFEAALRDFKSASKLEPSNQEYHTNVKRTRSEWDKVLVNRIAGFKREIAINPLPAGNYLEVGKSYNHLEDWIAAEEWYDKYLLKEEASPDEILRYTEILAKNEKYRKGEPILKRYTEMYPTDHRLWSRYGYFNLWMGNNLKAAVAFEESLKLRPYFKEAEEGLRLARGKGREYTYTSVKKATQEYIIDRYFRELKSNPLNNDTRMLLIKELMKHNRFEETYQQLQVIEPEKESFPDFDKLWKDVNEQREKVHLRKINELRNVLNKSPDKPDALLQLARRYSYVEEYDSSGYFYTKYLLRTPGDLQARFEFAKVLAWNLDYHGSKEQVSILLSLDPENREYQLLYAMLSVWMLQDMDKAAEYLNNILAADPNNLEALISAAALNMQTKNFFETENLLERAKMIAPENERIAKLESDLDFHKLRAEEERIFQILEEGRVLAMDNRCSEALELYEKYLPNVDPNRMVLREYADVNACAGNYAKALKIYDELLAEEYDFETDLQRAKVYYWSGDSLMAMKEFKRLYAAAPDNFDVKMYLGDTYTKLKKYPEAKLVYEQTLASDIDSTKRELITQRMGWLPVGGPGLGAWPNFIMLTPSALHYEDNLDFRYNLEALRVDLGLTSFMIFAPEAALGQLAADSIRSNFTSFKGSLVFRITELLTASGGVGVNVFSNYEEDWTADTYLKYEQSEKFSALFRFTRQDAAQVLYSPQLVDERFNVLFFSLAGFYRFTSNVRLSGYLNYLDVSDRNAGYILELEPGYHFTKRFYAAYEYYTSSFDRTSVYYFSPQRYTSHSAAAEYDFIREKVNRLTAGGKLGIIANSDFILREMYLGGMYAAFSNLALQGRITYSTSVQYDQGYSAFSVQLAAYWMY